MLTDDDWTPYDLQRHDEILDHAVAELKGVCVEDADIPHLLILYAVEFLSERPVEDLESAARLIADSLAKKREELN